MAGILLYLVTLLLESISVVVRFGLVSALVGLVAGQPAGMVAGAAAGLGPIVYSLLVLGGIPSGHILVRRGLEARPLSKAETAQLEAALAAVRARGVPIPRHIFAVDTEGLNAAISGRTLYIYRELFASRYLPGVLAHELGHFNSMDGRLLLGIRAFTVPGGFFIAYLLIGLLRWVAYGISTVLTALIVVVFAFFRMNLGGVAGALFGVSVQALRMGIIFAVGGVGPALLGSIWRSYLIEREFAADAYAGRLGYAYDLIDFFETEMLIDVAIPWYEQPSHPTATRRVASLAQVAARYPQLRPRPGAPAPPPPPAGPTPAIGQLAARPQGRRMAWALPLIGAALATALAVALLGGGAGQAADLVRPTPGPTPTLGLPAAP